MDLDPVLAIGGGPASEVRDDAEPTVQKPKAPVPTAVPPVRPIKRAWNPPVSAGPSTSAGPSASDSSGGPSGMSQVPDEPKLSLKCYRAKIVRELYSRHLLSKEEMFGGFQKYFKSHESWLYEHEVPAAQVN